MYRIVGMILVGAAVEQGAERLFQCREIIVEQGLVNGTAFVMAVGQVTRRSVHPITPYPAKLISKKPATSGITVPLYS